MLLNRLNIEGYSVDIPVFRIKKEIADIILSKSKNNIAALEKKLNETKKPFSFSTNVTVNGKAEISQGTGKYKKCCNAAAG